MTEATQTNSEATNSTPATAATVELLNQVAAEAQHITPLVKAAIPEIKAGYKSTEFWLVTGVAAGNVLYSVIAGKAFPLETNIVLVGVTTIYTVVRSLLKK